MTINCLYCSHGKSPWPDDGMSRNSISVDEYTWEVIIPGITNRTELAMILRALLDSSNRV